MKKGQKWKTLSVDGPPEEGQKCLCRYRFGAYGWDSRTNHYRNGKWINRVGEEDRVPDFYQVEAK